jgi:hypothetical protein
MDFQTQWRYCKNCHNMFYDGFGQKGHCPAETCAAALDIKQVNSEADAYGVCGHVAQPGSYQFFLPCDTSSRISDTNTLQGGWRFCGRCYTLFYEGFGAGYCVVGGGHVARGWHFALPHHLDADVLAHPHTQKHTQTGWRFCGRCSALFYDDGRLNTGQCAGFPQLPEFGHQPHG